MMGYQDEQLLRRCMHQARAEEVEEIAAIEAASFPPDEKASKEGILLRQQRAGEFFWVLGPMQELGMSGLVGFVNGTCTSAEEVTEESMERHEELGEVLIIHSVVVRPEYRRRGVASAMLAFYLSRIARIKRIRRVLLISKAYLLELYSSVGFQVNKLSPVVHGKDPWFEMEFDLSRARQVVQYEVDAFTNTAFSGNQAGVVFAHFPEELMQRVATENNFAETSFIEPIECDSELCTPEYYLRWFTPASEIELCGHATLAAAHALYQRGVFLNKLVKGNNGVSEGRVGVINFKTKYRGMLSVAVVKKEGKVSYELNFPGSLPRESPLSPPDSSSLCAALGISKEDIVFEGRGIDDVVIELTPSAFKSVPVLSSGKLDIARINSIDTTRGVIITTLGAAQRGEQEGDGLEAADFLSRFFCPKLGVDEDPVTGSAHCQLAPYWCKKLGIESLTGYQDSIRGGWVNVQTITSESEDCRVLLRGNAVTILKSYFCPNIVQIASK